MSLLEKRSELILEAIVTEYIETGEPVGSRTISKKREIGLSAASIRNIMCDLTDSGYITQPHISAGRVPTDLGYRFFVDTFVKTNRLASEESAAIESCIKLAGSDIRDIFKKSSWVLADFTKQAGVVSATPMVEQTFQAIEFIKISDDQILVVLISTGGFVQNKIIFDEDNISQETLEKYSRMLNDMLRDLDLDQAKLKIEQELAAEKTRFDAAMAKALRLSHVVLSANSARDVYIEGQSNILEDPEFNHIEKLKAILMTFEEKSKLLRILDKTLSADGLRIFIGSEHGVGEIETCSVIAYPIRTHETVLGSIGVIGPRRMNYRKVVPLVESTAGIISNIIRKIVEHET